MGKAGERTCEPSGDLEYLGRFFRYYLKNNIGRGVGWALTRYQDGSDFVEHATPTQSFKPRPLSGSFLLSLLFI